MQITRENQAKFKKKILIPLLTFAYFGQSYFYLKYAPSGLAKEVVACLGIALAGIFVFDEIYDRFYKVTLHQNFLEVKFAPMQIHHEFLYRHIADVEVNQSKKSFHDLILYLQDGEVHKIKGVDNAHEIRRYILERI